MKKIRAYAVLSLVATGCASLGGCSTEDEAPLDLAARLEADTGPPWAVWIDPSSHEVRFLSPKAPASIGEGSLEERSRAFFTRYQAQLHGTGQPDELRLLTTVVDDDGSTHLHFAHYLPSTTNEVFDTVSTAHFTPDGLLQWAQPGFRAELAGLSDHATLTPEAATRAALDRLAASCGPTAVNAPTTTTATTLGVHALEAEPMKLAYRVRTSDFNEQCPALDVDVDAATGSVLGTQTRSHALWDQASGARFHLLGDTRDRKTIDVTSHFHVIGPKTYSLASEVSPKVFTSQIGPQGLIVGFESATLGAWDTARPYKGVAVSAHFHGFHALRFFKEAKLRSGGDDVTLIVHDNTKVTANGMDAKAIGGQVHLGDGDVLAGGDRMPAAAAFDIVAHEIAHTITDKTSKLIYQREPGALSESFSDVMGASAEEWFNETTDATKNVIMGESWTKDGKGIRNMVDPRSLHDPDLKKDFLYCKEGEAPTDAPPGNNNDSCYVHYNSGIPNRAFTLMTLGGTHAMSKVTVTRGIGWKASRELWYKTLTNLRPQATFFEAAIAQIAVAGTTMSPQDFESVACAWSAVGVLELGTGIVLHPSLIGLTCPVATAPARPVTPPAPSSSVVGDAACTGKGNAVVCDDAAPHSARLCKNGGIVGTALCADLAQRCKRASASDPTGSMGADGTLACE